MTSIAAGTGLMKWLATFFEALPALISGKSAMASRTVFHEGQVPFFPCQKGP